MLGMICERDWLGPKLLPRSSCTFCHDLYFKHFLGTNVIHEFKIAHRIGVKVLLLLLGLSKAMIRQMLIGSDLHLAEDKSQWFTIHRRN
jgi:hypothetical protein